LMQRKFAEQYGDLEAWHWWFRGRQRILETVLARELNGDLPLSILSVGCGPPDGLTWLLPHVASNGRVVGIDANPIYVDRLRADVHYVIGKVEEIPFTSGTFDVVLALDVLEHLDDDVAGLGEATRLLKPGGLIIATVPALPSLWGGQDVISHHRRRYTKRALCQLFSQVNLAQVRVTYFNTFLFVPIALVRWIRRAMGLAQSQRSDFDATRPGLMNDLLTIVFSLERHIVCRMLAPIGVSLLAVGRFGG
jgi:SAM-dependent methyltransferase